MLLGNAPHLVWSAGALVAMGLLDVAHGAWEYGPAWSWLRALASGLGGTLFAAVWMPARFAPVHQLRLFLAMLAAMAAAVIIFIGIFRADLPIMWTTSGGYTAWSKGINTWGALGFVAASLFYFRRYAHGGQAEDRVFAAHTLLLGSATLLIWFSRNWHLEWWLWHALRLTAYLVVARAAYDVISHLQGELLRQSEDRTAAILKVALDAIVTMNHTGHVVDFNPAAERIFGYTRAQAIGQSMAELIIPEGLRERHQRGLAHYLATGEGPILGQRLELPALRADGTEFPIELAVARIPGEPPTFTAFIRDITERKRAVEALRDSEAVLRSVTDYARVGLVMLNEERRYVFANVAYGEILRLPPQDIIGRRVA